MHQPSQPPSDTDLSRRGFLRTSLLGAAVLGTASVGVTLTGCSEPPKAVREEGPQPRRYHFLTEDDKVILQAITPAILSGALPTEDEARARSLEQTVTAIDEAIHYFSPAIQGEFRQVFDLLGFAPSRALVAGVWRPWHEVDLATAETFLQRWRNSRFDLLVQAYSGLAKVTSVAFYGQPENWAQSHYPGPPAYAVQALPQFQPRNS